MVFEFTQPYSHQPCRLAGFGNDRQDLWRRLRRFSAGRLCSSAVVLLICLVRGGESDLG